MLYAGIEIGGTKLQVVTGEPSGKILSCIKRTVQRERGAAGIREQIQECLKELLAGAGIQAIGVGFGGPVDWRSGRICRSHQIEGWSEFDLAGWLCELTGAPVMADNDANVAALGEARLGAGRAFNPVFYVTLGSGVGGGLVVDGRIYHGASPGESEIGHVRLDRDGTLVEQRCSGWAVDARIRELCRKNPTSTMARLAGSEPGGEARHLAAALAQGDPLAKELLESVAKDLGFALSHVVHLFHPQAIIIGGGLSLVGEPLRVAIQASLRSFVMEAFAPGPQVCLAALGEDAVPAGALLMAGC